MDGDHTVERSFAATSRTLQAVFAELYAQGVRLEAMLLKPNMVVAGYACREQPTPEQVAAWTIRALRRHVPAAVPGITFLSGGQSDEVATANLDALNRVGGLPWQLSFLVRPGPPGRGAQGVGGPQRDLLAAARTSAGRLTGSRDVRRQDHELRKPVVRPGERQLILLRNGESTWNRDNRFTG